MDWGLGEVGLVAFPIAATWVPVISIIALAYRYKMVTHIIMVLCISVKYKYFTYKVMHNEKVIWNLPVPDLQGHAQ